ncbi:MAG: acetyl-CoA carboxylase biotin carboxylase subunit [Candidatus Competibacteraceae bacterium]|nr:acetyl-CoA carboxylase biotin carboxylase subunit [Candidatus Competibacteraceae bacterium]
MNKLLIANRGEIALRIMRSAHEMGIKTVAIYSEADRQSPHVFFADEAVCVGPAPSSQSYLNAAKIIEVACSLSVDAIHPGYGFLSENAEFARMVAASGITLVGPSPESMEIMGSKLGAKAAVKKYNIPLVPGTDHAISSVDEALKVGKEIGFPILIKASAGGGGKGMRIVEDESEFEENLHRAISEAESAFGDGSVFLEKYLRTSKHIEIQVLCDNHGNYLHLFERECSIQRRHQKVIEEAPSAILTPEQRAEMGAHAVNVARACNYSGAGTVEFIYSDGEYYFLEMNTRLQVEHPVTELITGVDLVKEQIRIARGEKLSFSQSDLSIHGHAIEVRVYAEDPANHFLPDIGTLHTYIKPQGPGIRIDDGFREGMQVPIYYDPMIAKMIIHAPTREEAIDRTLRAIDEYRIHGIKTTLDFCRFVLMHPVFKDGSFNTHFVNQHFKPEFLEEQASDDELKIAALMAAYLLPSSKQTTHESLLQSSVGVSAWRVNRGF